MAGTSTLFLADGTRAIVPRITIDFECCFVHDPSGGCLGSQTQMITSDRGDGSATPAVRRSIGVGWHWRVSTAARKRDGCC
jgi:hypothetical protein